jgi:hypothetical protein
MLPPFTDVSFGGGADGVGLCRRVISCNPQFTIHNDAQRHDERVSDRLYVAASSRDLNTAPIPDRPDSASVPIAVRLNANRLVTRGGESRDT